MIMPARDRRAVILEAAKQAFARYGYARTAMADIATLAGVSRPTLYAHFGNKEELLRTLARTLVDRALDAAEAAWPAARGFGAGLAAAVLAKDLEFFRLIHLSAHGAEMLTQNTALTADLHAEMESRFARLIAQRAGAVDSPQALGRVIVRAMEGIKQNAVSEAEFTDAVQRLARLFEAGVQRERRQRRAAAD